MRTAARSSIADAAEAAAPETPRWREPLAVIEAQTRVLLAQALTDTQRRALLSILTHTEHLSGDFAEHDRGRSADVASIPPLRSPALPRSPLGSLEVPEPAPQESHPRILVADDDPEMLELLVEILADRYQLTLARDGAEALAALASNTFSLAIVDLNLPILDGFGVAEAMRVSDRPPPPFMFLSAQASAQAKVRGLSLGAADYVTKPFDPDELTARIARIIATVTRESSLRADAMTDSLTGLCNYRSFTESLHREVERSRRYAEPLSLITVDLDHLKTINDELGHDAGNEAIVLLAKVLKGAVRKFEVVARNGGDEFALLLPNTDANEALALAERLRSELARHSLHERALTASIGVAARDQAIDLDGVALVKASDEALYRAKRAGRDRIALARLG